MAAKRDWSVSVFGCMGDMGLCCDVFWCYPCMQGRISNAVSGIPDNMNMGVCCGCCCCGLPPCRCFFNYSKRGAIASKYGIRQSCLSDCLLSLCCDLCVVCQHHAELSAQGFPPGHTCCAPSNAAANSPPVNMGMGAPPQGSYREMSGKQPSGSPPSNRR